MKIKVNKTGMISDTTIKELSFVMNDPKAGKNYDPAVPGAVVLMRKTMAEAPADRQARIAEMIGADLAAKATATPEASAAAEAVESMVKALMAAGIPEAKAREVAGTLAPAEKKTSDEDLAKAYDVVSGLLIDAFYAVNTAFYADMFTPDERKKAMQRIVEDVCVKIGDARDEVLKNLTIEKDEVTPPAAPTLPEGYDQAAWDVIVKAAENTGRELAVVNGIVTFKAKTVQPTTPPVVTPPAATPPAVAAPAATPPAGIDAATVTKMIADASAAQKTETANQIALINKVHGDELTSLRAERDAATALVTKAVSEAQAPSGAAGAANTPTPTGEGAAQIVSVSKSGGLSAAAQALLRTRGKSTVVLTD